MTTARATLMTKAGALESGRDLHVFVPGEYAVLRRFRLRRLLAFLWLQGCSATFFALLKQTDVYFCVKHLSRFVCNGQWTQALDYIVPRFLGPLPRSMEARLLLKFLSNHRSVEVEMARKRLLVDMRPVWAKAAEIVRDLASRTPEFRNRRLLPAGPMGQRDVLPIGFGFAPFRRKWHFNKEHRPVSASAIAKLYLDKRRSSLKLSSSHSSQELTPAEFKDKGLNWLRSIMKESLEVLLCPPKVNHGSSVSEGTLVTGNVINPECSSVLLSIDEGAPVARVCHAMFGNGINSAQNSTISSMAKAGSIACPAKISENVSATNDGTDQEVSYTESARQGSYPRKRPMTEQQEDYMDIKKQRTAGANGEASTLAQHVMEGEYAQAAGHLPPARSNQYC